MILENELLRVSIRSKGAELTSIYHKTFDLEYLWQANPAVWAKHSPVLFPIVGTLKENHFHFKGKSYSLGRHGIARDQDFSCISSSANQCIWELRSNNSTLEVYPFNFVFKVRYTLQYSSISVEYEIENNGNHDLFFSVGGHPAFNVPLIPGKQYSDYYLEFNQPETAPRWPITPDGLISANSEPFFKNARKLPLSHELFRKDALVFKSLSSTSIDLKSDSNLHGLQFDFTGFPYLGIWAARDADFVCIEPWCGIADSEDTDQDLTRKEGIERLSPGSLFSRTWKVRFY